MKTYWNFSDNRRAAPLSLDEFLDQQDADKFFSGKEPWLVGLDTLSWQTFFRVCTEEMDDLSQRAVKLVVEYCLEIVEGAEAKIQGNPTLPRLEKTLNLEYTEQYENPVYHYHWAMRHHTVSKAVNRLTGSQAEVDMLCSGEHHLGHDSARASKPVGRTGGVESIPSQGMGKPPRDQMGP